MDRVLKHWKVSFLLASPTKIFSIMQKLYTEEWSEKFRWGEARSFLTWPERFAEDLLNSQTLRSAGRSPAVDFWANRDKKLSGQRNYFRVWRRTDPTTSCSQGNKDGMTSFFSGDGGDRGRPHAQGGPRAGSRYAESRHSGRETRRSLS